MLNEMPSSLKSPAREHTRPVLPSPLAAWPRRGISSAHRRPSPVAAAVRRKHVFCAVGFTACAVVVGGPGCHGCVGVTSMRENGVRPIIRRAEGVIKMVIKMNYAQPWAPRPRDITCQVRLTNAWLAETRPAACVDIGGQGVCRGISASATHPRGWPTRRRCSLFRGLVHLVTCNLASSRWTTAEHPERVMTATDMRRPGRAQKMASHADLLLDRHSYMILHPP